MKIECISGETTTLAAGSPYAFVRDKFGRAVAEVDLPLHQKVFLSVTAHYREVPDVPEQLEADPTALRQDGPTIAEYLSAGYPAENYPPYGYASRSTPEEIEAAVAAQVAAKEAAEADARAAAAAAAAANRPGANIHGIGPDTDGGPNPDYVPPQPPADNEHVAPGATPFPEPAPVTPTFDTDIIQINGIGAKLKEKLVEYGITSIVQLANLTPEDADLIDISLDLNGRIEREKWVEQAIDIVEAASAPATPAPAPAPAPAAE